MYIKILIVLIFHTTFAFQGCKMHEFNQEKPADFVDAYKKSENKDINNVVIDTLHTSLADFISGKEKLWRKRKHSPSLLKLLF